MPPGRGAEDGDGAHLTAKRPLQPGALDRLQLARQIFSGGRVPRHRRRIALQNRNYPAPSQSLFEPPRPPAAEFAGGNSRAQVFPKD